VLSISFNEELWASQNKTDPWLVYLGTSLYHNMFDLRNHRILDRTTYGRTMLGTILLIILILILLGALPTWPYSGGWGYYPSGGIGLLIIIVIILLLAGRV
jgi:hypothetical protein